MSESPVGCTLDLDLDPLLEGRTDPEMVSPSERWMDCDGVNSHLTPDSASGTILGSFPAAAEAAGLSVSSCTSEPKLLFLLASEATTEGPRSRDRHWP